MGTVENKQLLQEIFSGTAQGDSRLLVESMSDDFRWTIAGNGKWSRTYQGKQAVPHELFGALRARIEAGCWPVMTEVARFEIGSGPMGRHSDNLSD